MQKLIGALLCCMLYGQSFSQATSSTTDSISIPATAQKLPVESIPKSNPSTLNIYPNPAKNKVTLQVAGFEPGIATVKIMDIKGKLVRQESRLLTNGSEEIIMFLMLQPGIYFIMVSEKGKLARKKIVML
jgi:hypothetical protein